jgi:hypothetical protein
VGDNADSHELLSVVAAVHHEGVGETLDDGALCLAETLLGEAAGGVRQVDGLTDLDVVAVWSHRQPLRSCIAVPVPLPLVYLQYRIPNPTTDHIHLFPIALSGSHSRQGDIPDLDILVAPLVEELGGANLLGDILGQHRVALGRLDLDFAVRHFR